MILVRPRYSNEFKQGHLHRRNVKQAPDNAPLVVATLDRAKELMTEVSDLQVVPLARLEKNKSYQVRVRAVCQDKISARRGVLAPTGTPSTSPISRSIRPADGSYPDHYKTTINPGTSHFRSSKTQYKEEFMFTAKISEKSIGKMRSMQLLAILLVPVVALIMGAAAPQVWADEFEDAKIIFETNFSDEDTGLQIFLDGGPWKEVEITGPKGEILEIEAEGRLRNFGLTEAFFESNEPNWDEVPLADILARFPQGNYRFKGRATDGTRLRSRAFLSHELPCAPDEDSLSPSQETVPANGIVIEWDHVTTQLDIEDEDCGDEPIDVVTYQVIVENVDTENKFSIFLEAQPSINQVTLPPEFIENDRTYKWEVLAIAENGNQTIAETYFCTGVEGALCDEPE